VDPRDQRIDELVGLLKAALDRIVVLEKRVTTLEAENAELRARLGQNSRNSSQPPSADPPGTPPRQREPTGKKPGGQPGHKGTKRELVPIEQVDLVVPVKPAKCAGCSGPLVTGDDAPEHRRHQVVELPKVVPHVTEYQLEFAYCRQCENWSCADLPAGVPESSFGPRLTAFTALCTGHFRMSKRQTQELLSDVYGLDVALGSVSNMEQTVSDALVAPVEEARAFVPTQPTVHQDETGWWEGKTRAWLWVASTTLVSVFRIVRSRGKDVAKQMLGEDFGGVLVSDRWCAYNWLHALRRQVCWAHLVREFEGFIERGGEAARIGEMLLAEVFVMFEWWHKARDGTLKRATFQKKMRPLMREVERLLGEASSCANARVAGTCREILKLREALWTFVYVEGVEPTNDMAERDLRHAVIWRKCSFGTKSEDGSRFVERVLTAVMTLRKQKRNVLDHLTVTCEAKLYGRDAPSLLPLARFQLKLAA
jgi:transposase